MSAVVDSELGRFFDAVPILEVKLLLRAVYDVASGVAPDVNAWVHGRELVFGKGASREGAGFVRALPAEVSITLAFPHGEQLFDPHRRLRGVKGSRLRLVLRGQGDLDPYVRRLIESAYVFEE